MTSPSGWYPDQQDPNSERYWDGQQWTPQTRPKAFAGAPPPPGSPAAPITHRPKRRRWPWVVAAVAVVIVIISVASANSGKKDDTASNDQTTAAPASHTTTTASKPANAAPPAPRTVATFTGSGTKKTKRFHITPDDWSLRYSYDCRNFGSQGNFQVFVYGDDDLPDVAVNELGAKKADSTEEHSSGDFYLEVNSECDWAIKVVA